MVKASQLEGNAVFVIQNNFRYIMLFKGQNDTLSSAPDTGRRQSCPWKTVHVSAVALLPFLIIQILFIV